MGGSYSESVSQCVSYASRMLEKEMSKIKQMEEKGLNPYELKEKKSTPRRTKEQRAELIQQITDRMKQGKSQAESCKHFGINVSTYKKWKQRFAK